LAHFKRAREIDMNIQIALEAGLRNSNIHGQAHFLLTTRNQHVTGLHCSCKL
jgi:hypothetical protein